MKKVNKKNQAPKIFKRDLHQGMEHSDVILLQKILNSDPKTRLEVKRGDGGSPGHETENFYQRTADAVQEFQRIHKIVEVGSKTRQKLNEILEDGENKNPISNAVQADSPKIQDAIIKAREQLKRRFQPCKSKICKHNMSGSGSMPCNNPNPRADNDDKKMGNEENDHPYWSYYCLKFVRTSYNMPIEFGRAILMFQDLEKKRLINLSNEIPVGALVFWHWKNFGHIGIHTGNSSVIHTGINRMEFGVREEPLQEITSRLKYLGWAHPPKHWLK